REDAAFTDPKLVDVCKVHENIDLRAFAYLIAAYERMYKGKLTQAFQYAHQAKALFITTAHRFLESYADLIIILCDRYLGRGDHAVLHMAAAYQQVAHLQLSPVWVNLATGMMVVHYERNDLTRASAFCEALLPAVNVSCAPAVVAHVYLHRT